MLYFHLLIAAKCSSYTLLPDFGPLTFLLQKTFKSFVFPIFWLWVLFQKHVVHTKLDIYFFICHWKNEILWKYMTTIPKNLITLPCFLSLYYFCCVFNIFIVTLPCLDISPHISKYEFTYIVLSVQCIVRSHGTVFFMQFYPIFSVILLI